MFKKTKFDWLSARVRKKLASYFYFATTIFVLLFSSFRTTLATILIILAMAWYIGEELYDYFKKEKPLYNQQTILIFTIISSLSIAIIFISLIKYLAYDIIG
ncbi:MAG: hypothetical protein KGV51_01635 [Moraxellaceae bacterium]|nr:hypothetical protein [Moraxellaceae bacterium]